jgi:XTP/dITP diphosphohydrolase
MTQLIFATNNPNKVIEIQSLLPENIKIVSLKEAGLTIDIPEPHDSLELNAREKSTVIFQLTGENCFGEDTGLEIDALQGAPGVKTARFAGPNADANANMQKVLEEMKDMSQRTARFKTFISLIMNGNEFLFTGICEGKIAMKPKGEKGFGYDPIFIPNGSEVCFAEMDLKEKNIFSHRKKATAQLIQFLKHYGTH